MTQFQLKFKQHFLCALKPISSAYTEKHCNLQISIVSLYTSISCRTRIQVHKRLEESSKVHYFTKRKTQINEINSLPSYSTNAVHHTNTNTINPCDIHAVIPLQSARNLFISIEIWRANHLQQFINIITNSSLHWLLSNN